MLSWQMTKEALNLSEGTARFRIYKAKKKWVLHYYRTDKRVWDQRRRRYNTHAEALSIFNEIQRQSIAFRETAYSMKQLLPESNEINA